MDDIDNIDYDALSTADKFMSVFLTVSIILTNSFLIFKTVSLGRFLYTPRSLIVISLAIGDIFLALFPLVVYSKIYYNDASDLSCGTVQTAFVYMFFLIHFVFGIGMVVMAVELVHRYKKQRQVEITVSRMIKSVAYSSVPWVLGLIIVLPVTMANIHIDSYFSDFFYRYCIMGYTQDKRKPMYAVSVVVPVVLSLIASISIRCVQLMPLQHINQVVGYHGNTQGIVISTHNTTSAPNQYFTNGAAVAQSVQTSQPVEYYNVLNNQDYKDGNQEHNISNTQYLPPQYPTTQYPPPQPQQYPPSQSQQYSSPQSQQYPPPQPQQYLPPQPQQYLPPQPQQYLPQQPQQYPPQQYTPQQYPPQQQIAQANMVISTPFYSTQPQIPAVHVPQNPDRERNLLFIITILYTICVIPYAIFDMTDTNYGNNAIIINEILFWLSVFRSLLSPTVWLQCTRR